MDESKSIRSLDDADMSVEDKMDVLETLRGRKLLFTIWYLNKLLIFIDTNMLGNSALNMLKTHGIADMMQDNQIGNLILSTIVCVFVWKYLLIIVDDEASKKMLNTALRNGRQLVLSEGGRMLLHETNRGSTVKQSTNGSINNSLRTSAINLQHPSTNQTNLNSSPQKIRMNVIKQKDSSSSASAAGGVTKNKVRNS